MSARIVVSNWKYSRLYKVGVHDKILENQGGRGRISFRLPLERFEIHRMGNLLGLGDKSVCGVFIEKFKMTLDFIKLV